MKEISKYCSICGCELKGMGHNAKPYIDGRCCGNCNSDKVLPLRYFLLTAYGIVSYNSIQPMYK